MKVNERYVELTDYYNRKKKRNVDNTKPKDYNCGGYALRTFNWYQPDRWCKYDDEDLYWERTYKGDDDETIMRLLLARSKKMMLREFGEDLWECNKNTVPGAGEEKIAFRVCVTEDDFIICDFHYRVLRDGKWREKCGTGEIKECDFTEEPWKTNATLIYDSPILYFIHRI